jgi:hypothetical protein
LFDTIYHEHLDYHSVVSLAPFLERHGLDLFAVESVTSHGGSLRGFAQKAGGPHERDGSVESTIARERALGLDRLETWRAFGARIDAVGAELRGLLGDIKKDGKSIAGYGAPAKATTLMHHFGIGADTVDFIVDDNPLKQGLVTPGVHIPVVAHDAIARNNPDYLLVLAWNFADSIIEKESAFRERGGRFIVPLPEVEVR